MDLINILIWSCGVMGLIWGTFAFLVRKHPNVFWQYLAGMWMWIGIADLFEFFLDAKPFYLIFGLLFLIAAAITSFWSHQKYN